MAATHHGKVMVMRSNLRWCSGGFEITCWIGEVARGTLVLSAHDREAIAWRAVVGAGIDISGSYIRDVMLEAVEKRFSTIRAPYKIEWLSDGVTLQRCRYQGFAGQFHSCILLHPAASSESNGMSKAFAKTLKCDSLRVRPMPGSATALGLTRPPGGSRITMSTILILD